MGEYVVKKPDTNDEDFLKDILELDKIVYTEDVQGNLIELQERFKSKKQDFLLVYKEKRIIGYMCFFPISDKASKQIQAQNKIYDNNIKAKDICNYRKDKATDIYVISVVITPEEQDTDAIRFLTNNFIIDLKEKIKQGFILKDIFATAVTNDGKKFLKNLNFKEEKVFENDYKLMKCNINDLRSIHFAKTYKDDLYIMIPLKGNEVTIPKNSNDIGDYYINSLYRFSNYECNNNIAQSLKRTFLGEIPIGCIDDYYTKEVIDSQIAYLFLTSHIDTKLHILTVVVPNNKLSTTMLQDQASSNNLYIKDGGNWRNLFEYIFEKYKLKKCGEPKTIVCLSNKPRNENEMRAMLASEAFDGEYNLESEELYLTSNKLDQISNNNISQYAFCETYASEVAVIYVLKGFKDNFKENLGHEELVIFIVELTMFQFSAINRTNQKIVEGLSKEGNVSLKFIENLYKELGKTVIFWNNDNFYYSSSQSFADAIYRSFKTHESFELYKKNQYFLEHIVDLKNAQSTNRENKILNIIVIILTCLQVIPVIISFITWLLDITSPYTVLGVSGTSVTIIILLIIILIRRNKETKKKRKNKI